MKEVKPRKGKRKINRCEIDQKRGKNGKKEGNQVKQV